MKKILWLALGLAVTFSFLGGHLFLSSFQTVPVTVAQSSSMQSVALVASDKTAFSTDLQVTAVRTPTAFPTLAPTETEQSFPAEPAATNVATKSITQTPITNPTFVPIITEQILHAESAATVVAAKSITLAPTRTAEEALLDQFIEAVSSQGTDLVTGVYVPGRFSLPVVQQPVGNASFVSTENNNVTQFGTASVYGTIGLLAHNYLSGTMFFDLRAGDDVVIVYGNKTQVRYRITQIERFQALSPTSVYSDFIDVNDPNQTKLTSIELFQRIYTKDNRLVLQTCINANNDPAWGRMFVIEERVGQ
jgi:hypothetical protein